MTKDKEFITILDRNGCERLRVRLKIDKRELAERRFNICRTGSQRQMGVV